MKACLLPALALSALLGSSGVLAQEKPMPVTAAVPMPVPAPVPEPAVKRIVSEDDRVRIEELRVRGQTKNITVKSKIPGVATYEIVPATSARDPSQPGNAPGQGQSLWRFPAF